MAREVQIGAEAMRVMVAEFRAKTPAAIIVRLVAEQTGEQVTERTVARRAAAWRAEQARRQSSREQVEDLVAAMKAQDVTAAEMAEALMMDALAMHPERFQNADAVKVVGTGLYAREVRLKERKIALQERAIAAVEKKLEMLLDKQRRADAAAAELEAKAERGEQISAEDVARIRSIYGLGDGR